MQENSYMYKYIVDKQIYFLPFFLIKILSNNLSLNRRLRNEQRNLRACIRHNYFILN